MPELRNVRPEDAIQAFSQAGGLVRWGKGSHMNIKMPNGQIVTIPVGRGPVKQGLLRAAIRKAGITEAEYIRLLEA
ncbi:MAG: putative RNA binding protein YcfA, dsRBD-like fold, HicA-like mRNA interferase family [Chloroflexi bacterium]|jgi:predicted RNA binding protein YcfA (HicA-like mRNA interferase family)|nr:MAG: putative RNA binding protein YcfA, dsRBD-like fold, HicA-like mRNA interferase family [Chloroflexota bacterium]